MSAGLITITIITVYFALAAAAAPRLMRLVYRDNLAMLAQRKQRYEEKMDAWRARKDRSAFNMPLWDRGSELDCMMEARRFGYWLALAWPISLSFYQFGDSAFKQEIAAQSAKQNAKVISDYERLLAEKFDKELADATSPTLIRRLTRKAQK